MRVLIVGRRQAGETRRSIAGAVGVSPATVRKWLRRHESEGAAGLQDRTSRRIACARGSNPGPRDRAVARDRGPRREGWEYLHLAVDDHARLAYSEILAG